MLRNFQKINYMIVRRTNLYHRIIRNTNSNVLSQPFRADLRIEKISSLLTNYGFNPGQISRILKSPDSILSFSEDQLSLNLFNWLSFDAKDKIFTTLCAYPELLTLNPDYVNSRAKELMTLFTKKDIAKLLVTCPSVFTEDFETIFNKVEYIVHMMGVEQKSIVKSRALQFDLLHIKCRHLFLIRAGYYVKPKKTKRTRNPPLDKIFNRNIESFLKITKLSEEEYDAFCHCFEQELIDEEDDDSDTEDW